MMLQSIHTIKQINKYDGMITNRKLMNRRYIQLKVKKSQTLSYEYVSKNCDVSMLKGIVIGIKEDDECNISCHECTVR